MIDVYILNGAARCGKDTFCDILADYACVYHESIISPMKAFELEMRGKQEQEGKNEKYRKFLCDLKLLTEEYNDYPFRCLTRYIDNINNFKEETLRKDYYIRNPIYRQPWVIVIDMREKKDIERAVKEFNAKTILIKNDRVTPITSNEADKNVFEYQNYDYVIENNGTKEDFRKTIEDFFKSLQTENSKS